MAKKEQPKVKTKESKKRSDKYETKLKVKGSFEDIIKAVVKPKK